MDEQGRTQILNYGGGRQTAALCVLVKRGVLPRPDRIVIADTGREKQSTWDYLDEVIQPMLSSVGLTVEIAPRSLAYVDLYGHNGDLLIPVYTATGKLSAFCSTEWKARPVRRYLRGLGVESGVNWIGFTIDERQRIKTRKDEQGEDAKWTRSYPLCDLMLTKQDCINILTSEGLPVPPPSSCWMCSNMANEEWRYIRDEYPPNFESACVVDEEVRAEDIANGGTGVWLHHSRVPLREADLEAEDRKGPTRQCGLGICFV